MSETHELTDAQRALVERALDPHAGTRAEFTAQWHVPENTQRSWEKKPWFNAAVQQRMVELNISPVRLQAVLDSMYTEARNGNVQAAKVYLGYLELLNPTKPIEQRSSVQEMSDEELEKYLLA